MYELRSFLSEIDHLLVDDRGRPQRLLGEENFETWEVFRLLLKRDLDPQIDVSDLVVFDRENHSFWIVLTKGESTERVLVTKDGIDKAQFDTALARLSTGKNPRYLSESMLFSSHELAVYRDLRKDYPRNLPKVRRISPITNEIPLARHRKFEREGAFFTRLRHQGVSSLGELQELNRYFFENGIRLHPTTKEIDFDRELAQAWLVMRSLEDGAETSLSNSRHLPEMMKAAREKVFFGVITGVLEKNHELVEKFVVSAVFRKYKRDFCDRVLSGYGQTDLDIAKAMLGNYYLYKFEGADSPLTSEYWSIFASMPYFLESIEEFCFVHKNTIPIPLPTSDRNFQTTYMSDMVNRFFTQEELENTPFCRFRFGAGGKARVISDANSARVRAKAEINRHPFHEHANQLLARRGFIVEPASDLGVFGVLIGNVALATDEERRNFTISRWFPDADAYWPKGPNLPEIVDVDTYRSPTTFTREILGETTFEGQMRRLMGNCDEVMEFLQTDTSVPDEVRAFFSQLGSDELVTKILARYGKLTDQDPNIVNRFFPGGLHEFRKMACYRFVNDFVRGVETNLLFQTSNSLTRAGRRLQRKFKHHDFSKVDENQWREAIDLTLKMGANRIRLLNHEVGVGRHTLKDWQEFFEKTFGWDSRDMSYLRWEKFWDIWNILGGAWDCVCFSRKPIFNVRVLPQW